MLEQQSAVIAYADIKDHDAFHVVFKKGRTLFILNPPASVKGDTDAGELK